MKSMNGWFICYVNESFVMIGVCLFYLHFVWGNAERAAFSTLSIKLGSLPLNNRFKAVEKCLRL